MGDSTILPVYKNQRIQRHKSLARIASCGKNSMGWFYGDRGYISQDLKSKLKDQGIDLITDHRKNMQSIQLCKSDEYHLKQRNKIETLFSLLKGQYNLVTSKARSIHGFLAGIYAPLCAYQLTQQNRPTIQIMESLA